MGAADASSMLALIDDKAMTPLGATARKNATATLGGHALEEAVLVETLAFTRLISPLHDRFPFPPGSTAPRRRPGIMVGLGQGKTLPQRHKPIPSLETGAKSRRSGGLSRDGPR